MQTFTALAAQVSLGMVKDMFRHQHRDHVLEGFTHDGKGVVVGISMNKDLLVCFVVSCCIKVGPVSGVDQCADSVLKDALGNSMQALSVEDIQWSGIFNAQSRNDMINIIFLSKDRACCILSSFEVAHLEFLLGQVGLGRLQLESKLNAFIVMRGLVIKRFPRQRHNLARTLLIISQVT